MILDLPEVARLPEGGASPLPDSCDKLVGNWQAGTGSLPGTRGTAGSDEWRWATTRALETLEMARAEGRARLIDASVLRTVVVSTFEARLGLKPSSFSLLDAGSTNARFSIDAPVRQNATLAIATEVGEGFQEADDACALLVQTMYGHPPARRFQEVVVLLASSSLWKRLCDDVPNIDLEERSGREQQLLPEDLYGLWEGISNPDAAIPWSSTLTLTVLCPAIHDDHYVGAVLRILKETL